MAKKAEEKEEKASVKKAEEKADSKEEKHSLKAEKESPEAEKAKTGEESRKYEKKPGEEKAREEKHGHREEKKEHEAKRQYKKQKPKRGKTSRENFVELKPAEITEAIVQLANEGRTASEIGMILRDQYGIPKVSKVAGKKIAAILEEQKLLPKIPEDLMSLIRKSVVLREHLAKNKKDMSAKRGLMLTVSKIRALEKYYKRKGKLPLQWRYSPETAALLAK